MDYKIRWTSKAFENLDSICEFISKESPFYSSITASKIISLVDKLSKLPYSGRIVPEYKNY
ncbi:MAG TPA: hypothetical protein PKY56_00290 [Candidatus Kapabacteria bacterium]|nr:hypothetical protein [Candidatus Kapabacteria bacterium]HPO61574.1 hypothetical protein [Candidatus Kapabacteria bacterium]